MNKYSFCLLVILGLVLISCVANKDLVYLQNKDNAEGAAAVNPIVAKPYRLQTNDIISIQIKANDPKLVTMFTTYDMSSKTDTGLYFDGYTVDDHGNIRIPILGELNVLGYTLEETRVFVEKKLLEEYFNKEANIFVTIKLAGLRYTINGEIFSPGTKTLFQEKVTILEAIANSGDITMVGDRKAVSVLRRSPLGMELHDIDLTDRKAMQSPYFYVQPNDYIYIKPLKQKSWGTGKTGIESLSTIITVLSLLTTTLFFIKLK